MKKLLALVLVLVLVLSLSACGGKNTAAGKNGEVELTTDNILDYIHISITYTNTGTSIVGKPEMERTIKIYPTKGGSFNNVQLLLFDMLKDCKFQAESNDLHFYDIGDDQVALKKISLPADGNFTCTDKLTGNTVLSKLPSNEDSSKGWDYISVNTIGDSEEKWFGSDFVKAGDPVVTGMFKAD